MTPTQARPMTLGRGSVATSNRLTLSDSLTFDEWCAIGSKIAGIADASAWWLGDWLFYGQWQYGKKYIAAVEITGLDEGTLRNYSSVAGRFELSRRRDNLSFSHHQAAVALPLVDADRFLDLAVAGGWSMRRLRDEIRAAKVVSSPPAPAQIGPPDAPIPSESIVRASEALPIPDYLRFDVPVKRMRAWSAAASSTGQTLHDWAITTLDTAAAIAAA